MLNFLLEQGVAFLLGVGGGLLVDRLRRAGEQRGALRLLRAEIDRNEDVLRIVRERRGDRPEDMIGDQALPSLNTDAWHDAVRAGVLPDALFKEVDGYYAPLEKLLSLLRMQGSMDEFMERWLRSAAAELKPEWDVPRSRNPYVEYMIQVLEAQDRARDRINLDLVAATSRSLYLRRHLRIIKKDRVDNPG